MSTVSVPSENETSADSNESVSFAKNAVCAACGKTVNMDDTECANCGAKLSNSDAESLAEELTTVVVVGDDEDEGTACPECGSINDGDAQVCDQCGCNMQGNSGAEASVLPTWEGELAFEGLPSSDGRVLMAGQITNRDLPLTLMFQYVTAEGHMGAEACGKITQIWREDRPEMGVGVVAVMGAGEFSNELMGPTAAASVEGQIIRHVSVDVAPHSKVLLSAQTLQEVPAEEQSMESYMNGDYLVGIGGEIMGATIVPFSAFADAQLRTVAPDAPKDVVLASAWIDEKDARHLQFTSSGVSFKLIPVAVTASAAGLAPIAPPKEWFFTPEPEGKFPLTVMDDGRIMGHLATWDQCHHGFARECVLAKGSRTGYSFFHVGALKTAEGEFVDVGRIIVGETAADGHASVQYNAAKASQHYDKSGLVGAFVRATDGKYGIWLSGVVRSDCPAERVRDMLANPPSGDWRRENGWLELIAALSVPVPGYPVPRYEYSLTASAEDVEVQTMIASGYYEVEGPTFSRAEQRKRAILLAEAKTLA